MIKILTMAGLEGYIKRLLDGGVQFSDINIEQMEGKIEDTGILYGVYHITY